MKKFKGVVNGVSYDTEKSYREAVDKALKDGNINAYSNYIEVDEPKKETDKTYYQFTKEDMDEIRLFNKNFKALKSFIDKVDATTFTNTIRIPDLTKIIDAFNF
jgi:hypothetical protein